MGVKTPIQWCDSTLNIQMGCDGCELWNPRAGVRKCYAGVMTERWAGTKGWPEAFDRPKLFPERLPVVTGWRDLAGKARPDKPWIRPDLPRVVFLDDVGDTFTESLPEDWLAPFLGPLAASRHVYVLLTKRPQKMAGFFGRHGPVPHNFWLCTSVTNRASLPRVGHLAAIDSPVLGLSVEPLWEGIDWAGVPGVDRVRWVKIGGESDQDSGKDDPPAPCDLARVRETRDFFLGRGVPVFVKQLGAIPVEGGRRLKLRDGHGGDWDEWPPDLRVREMPR
jgi:protein gp37